MALIKCGECGKNISDKAEACPHCGNPIEKKKIEKEVLSEKNNNLNVIIAFILSFILFILLIAEVDFAENESNVRSMLYIMTKHNLFIIYAAYGFSVLLAFLLPFKESKLFKTISKILYVIAMGIIITLCVLLRSLSYKMLIIYPIILIILFVLFNISRNKKIDKELKMVSEEEIEEIEKNNLLLQEKFKQDKKIFKYIIDAILLLVILGSSLYLMSEPPITNGLLYTSISQLKANETMYIKVDTKYINVREDASTKSQKIGEVKESEVYTVIDITKNGNYTWYKIKDSNGFEGYVATNKTSNYLKVEIKDKKEKVKIDKVEEIKKTENQSTTKKTTTRKTTTTHVISGGGTPTLEPTPNPTPNPTPSPTPNTTTTTTTTTTKKATVTKKKIDATPNYSCDEGYTLSGTKCESKVESTIKPTCPYGYSAYGESNCKIDAQLKDATNCRSCNSGYRDMGNGVCYNGMTSYVKTCYCPSQYTQQLLKCVVKAEYLYADPISYKKVCPYGYDLTSAQDYCIRTLNAQVEYSCPSGYTLSGTKCIED